MSWGSGYSTCLLIYEQLLMFGGCSFLIQILLNLFEVNGGAGTTTTFNAAAFSNKAAIHQATHVKSSGYKNEEYNQFLYHALTTICRYKKFTLRFASSALE